MPEAMARGTLRVSRLQEGEHRAIARGAAPIFALAEVVNVNAQLGDGRPRPTLIGADGAAKSGVRTVRGVHVGVGCIDEYVHVVRGIPRRTNEARRQIEATDDGVAAPRSARGSAPASISGRGSRGLF